MGYFDLLLRQKKLQRRCSQRKRMYHSVFFYILQRCDQYTEGKVPHTEEESVAGTDTWEGGDRMRTMAKK